MARTASLVTTLAACTAVAAVLVPTSGAGADNSCVAWGRLPGRVVLGPDGVTVRATLAGTAACTGVTTDNGGSAVLRGPGSNNDAPLRWSRLGDTDEATYYPSLNRPGTYRLVDGDLQTYDAEYRRIPATWHVTSTVVKYEGRFVYVSRGRGVSATLEFYGRAGWQELRNVTVALQRRTGSGAWKTLARTRSSASGQVRFDVRTSARASYRLVSATSTNVWGAVRHFGADPT